MFNRREALKYTAAATALMGLDPWSIIKASSHPHHLSRKAYKNVTEEGTWQLNHIDGTLPNLNGEVLRVGPGIKNNFGHKLRHFFDGDAFLNQIIISQNGVQLKAQFIQTPQRMKEQRKKQMLFDEFGTEAPKNTYKRKNQPNINLIKWNEHYLALSEGGAPSLLHTGSLDFRKFEYFNGKLKKNIGMSAHPKIDPISGNLYTFGIEQGLSKALVVYELNKSSGELKVLYRLKQKHIYMIHDMMITENHIIFLIPPAYFKIMDIVFDKGSLADAIEYDPKLGTTLLILDKKGKSNPIEKKLPPGLVFHNSNAYEENDSIYFDSFIAEDHSLLNTISNWKLDKKEKSNTKTPQLNSYEFNLASRTLHKKSTNLGHHDFPIFNGAYTTKKNRYLYCAKLGPAHDLIAMSGTSKYDKEKDTLLTYETNSSELFGEPIYAQGDNILEDDGYLLVPGYNADKDESFLEIINAIDMSFQARIWYDRYLPLGFHGNFYSA